jgi:hypothetical protein
MSSFALYIPSIYANITETMISKTFHRMEVGKVGHVEIISHSEKTNKAHVYFDTLYDTESAAEIATTIKNGGTAKLKYARNEHVFWILLESRREYDGVSRIGEFVDEPEFTEEEMDFMESHMYPDTSLVDAQYVGQVEADNFHLRNMLAQQQMHYDVLYNNYNQMHIYSMRMNDALSKWLQLADSNQMDRLRRAMLRYMGKDLTKDIEEGEICDEIMVGEVSC